MWDDTEEGKREAKVEGESAVLKVKQITSYSTL